MLSLEQEKTYTRDELQIFNLIDQPVWCFDIVKKAMWFANTAAVELWSAKSLEDLLERNFSEDMSEATARRLDDYLVKFKRGERLKDQWTFYPNGQRPKTLDTIALGIHIEEGRMAMLIQGVYKDMSKKADQQALRAVEMLRHLPVPVTQFDIQGNVMEQNPEALAAFGSIKELDNPPRDGVSMTNDDDDDESTVTDVDDVDDEDVFDLGGTSASFVNRFVDPDVGRKTLENVTDGKDCSLEAQLHTVHGPRWSSVRVRQAKDPVTTEPVLLFSARDITQVVDAKLQVEKANIAKSDFFAMMQHEIRTPLHHVVGMVEVASQTELTEQDSNIHNVLRSSANLLLTVIHDLFDSMDGKKDGITLDYTTFNVAEVVHSVTTTIAARAKAKNLQTKVNISPRLGMMSFNGDPNRLRQILFNLLHNACKYTQSGGIELTVQRHSKTRGNRTWLRFVVKDTGIGISLQQRQRLFEKRPLSQLDGESGVGLSICKALVDAMGGRIGVESHAGSGSTLWFELPFRRSASVSPLDDLSGHLDPVPDEGGLRILLVDSDPINCELMRNMLEKSGNTVVICSDGPAMIKQVRETSFDVALVEVQLPGMSGLEATQQIRSLGHSLESFPILAVTTLAPPFNIADTGFNNWLTKPLLMKDIRIAMTEAMCNCAGSVGTTTAFTGSCDGTYYSKRDTAQTSMLDNLVSLSRTGMRETDEPAAS